MTKRYGVSILARSLLLIAVCSVMLPLLSCFPLAGDSGKQNPEIKLVNGKDFKKGLEELKNKIVVLNFWATWCAPCREEFPALVEFSKKFRAKGIKVLTVSLDDEKALAAVQKFLSEQKAETENYLLDLPGSDMDAFISGVDPKWSGALPATFVYDRNGKLVNRHIGASTFKDFEQLVKPLL